LIRWFFFFAIFPDDAMESHKWNSSFDAIAPITDNALQVIPQSQSTNQNGSLFFAEFVAGIKQSFRVLAEWPHTLIPFPLYLP
jgi:hypothetical protein